MTAEREVLRLTGTVYSGSGSASRNLGRPKVRRRLAARLRQPMYPGSLNLRVPGVSIPEDLGPPAVEFIGRKGRDYQLWPAWIKSLRVWAMVPGKRGHGPDSLEVLAGVRLRDHLGIADGQTVTISVEVRR